MAGKLYLCATPIGNLEDITFPTLGNVKGRRFDRCGRHTAQH